MGAVGAHNLLRNRPEQCRRHRPCILALHPSNVRIQPVASRIEIRFERCNVVSDRAHDDRPPRKRVPLIANLRSHFHHCSTRHEPLTYIMRDRRWRAPGCCLAFHREVPQQLGIERILFRATRERLRIRAGVFGIDEHNVVPRLVERDRHHQRGRWNGIDRAAREMRQSLRVTGQTWVPAAGPTTSP